ncbi:hypothetical protein ACJX0J_032120, partial [Zea mays]
SKNHISNMANYFPLRDHDNKEWVLSTTTLTNDLTHTAPTKVYKSCQYIDKMNGCIINDQSRSIFNLFFHYSLWTRTE